MTAKCIRTSCPVYRAEGGKAVYLRWEEDLLPLPEESPLRKASVSCIYVPLAGCVRNSHSQEVLGVPIESLFPDLFNKDNQGLGGL
jgi:hypothetical protein